MPSAPARPCPTPVSHRRRFVAAIVAAIGLTGAVAPAAGAAPRVPAPTPRTTAGTGPASSDATMRLAPALSPATRHQLAVVRATTTTTRAGGRVPALAPVLGTFTWVAPVRGTHQSSGFGQRWGRLHAGADFAGPIGLPIRSVCGGTVTWAGPQGGYGNKVQVLCWDGTTTAYGHMHTVAATLGQRVSPGTRIGSLGNTGRSTGPHLHFEVRPDGITPIDPMPWMDARGIRPAQTPAAPNATVRARR